MLILQGNCFLLSLLSLSFLDVCTFKCMQTLLFYYLKRLSVQCVEICSGRALHSILYLQNRLMVGSYDEQDKVPDRFLFSFPHTNSLLRIFVICLSLLPLLLSHHVVFVSSQKLFNYSLKLVILSFAVDAIFSISFYFLTSFNLPSLRISHCQVSAANKGRNDVKNKSAQ